MLKAILASILPNADPEQATIVEKRTTKKTITQLLLDHVSDEEVRLVENSEKEPCELKKTPLVEGRKRKRKMKSKEESPPIELSSVSAMKEFELAHPESFFSADFVEDADPEYYRLHTHSPVRYRLSFSQQELVDTTLVDMTTLWFRCEPKCVAYCYYFG